MNFKTVALLHPGNMGATIGAAAATSGARVIWVSHQRSPATQDRAKRAGLIDVKNLTDAVRESEVILSVCPPDAALDLARKVAEHNFKGLYVDANAVSRATAEEIGDRGRQPRRDFLRAAAIPASRCHALAPPDNGRRTIPSRRVTGNSLQRFRSARGSARLAGVSVVSPDIDHGVDQQLRRKPDAGIAAGERCSCGQIAPGAVAGHADAALVAAELGDPRDHVLERRKGSSKAPGKRTSGGRR